MSGDFMNPGRGITARMKKASDKDYFIHADVTVGSLSRDRLVAYCIRRGEEYSLGGTFFKRDWTESVVTTRSTFWSSLRLVCSVYTVTMLRLRRKGACLTTG